MAAVAQEYCEMHVNIEAASPKSSEESVGARLFKQFSHGFALKKQRSRTPSVGHPHDKEDGLCVTTSPKEDEENENAEESSVLSTAAKLLKKLSSSFAWMNMGNGSTTTSEPLAPDAETAAPAPSETPQTRVEITGPCVQTFPKSSGASSPSILTPSTEIQPALMETEMSSVRKNEDINSASPTAGLLKQLSGDLIWKKRSSSSQKSDAAQGTATKAQVALSDRRFPSTDSPSGSPAAVVASSQALTRNLEFNLVAPSAIAPQKAGDTLSTETSSIPAGDKTSSPDKSEDSDPVSPESEELRIFCGQTKEALRGIANPKATRSLALIENHSTGKADTPAITQITMGQVLAAAAQVQGAAIQVEKSATELQAAAAEVQQAAAQVKAMRDRTATLSAPPIATPVTTRNPDEVEHKGVRITEPSEDSANNAPSSRLIKKISDKFNVKRLLHFVSSPDHDAKFQRASSPVSSGSSHGEEDQAAQTPDSALDKTAANAEQESDPQNESHAKPLMKKISAKLAMIGIRAQGSEARFHMKASPVSV